MAQESREGESTLIPYYPQNNGNTLKVLEKNCKKKETNKIIMCDTVVACNYCCCYYAASHNESKRKKG